MTHAAFAPVKDPTTVSCLQCPLRPLDVFKHRGTGDINYIQSLKAGESFFPAGTTIVEEKQPNSRLFTVLSGWVYRYRTLDDKRRQIVNYGLPGDFLGLQATLDDVMGHGIEALTDVTLCIFPRERLWDLFGQHPQLSFDVTWLAAQQERSLEEHILTLGQRTAVERIAYMLWYLFDRMRELGLARDNTVEIPLRQQHLAETLGLSLVHINKTLQKIREEGAIVLKDRALTVVDEALLRERGRVDVIPPRTRPLL